MDFTLEQVSDSKVTDLLPAFVSSSVFALHFTEPPISAQLLAFLRVFCMTEGKSFQGKKRCSFFFNSGKYKASGFRLKIKLLETEVPFGGGHKMVVSEKEKN